MEKTKHNGTGGRVQSSLINTFSGDAPKAADSAKKRSISCPASIDYCQISTVMLVHPHQNMRLSVLEVPSDGAV